MNTNAAKLIRKTLTGGITRPGVRSDKAFSIRHHKRAWHKLSQRGRAHARRAMLAMRSEIIVKARAAREGRS